MKFGYFSDIYFFPKILSLLSRLATRDATLVYTNLLLIGTFRFTRGKRKTCSTTKKSQIIINMIVAGASDLYIFINNKQNEETI